MVSHLTKLLTSLVLVAVQVKAQYSLDQDPEPESCSCENNTNSEPYEPIFSNHTNPLWNKDNRDPLDMFQEGNNNSYSPPFPWSPTRGVDGWAEAIGKARQYLVDNDLTIEEKVALATGIGWEEKGYLGRACVGNIGPIERIGFKGLCLQDSPAGIRLADGVSVFPSGINIASTFDRDLMYQRAAAMAAEFKGKGIHIALAPGESRVAVLLRQID